MGKFLNYLAIGFIPFVSIAFGADGVVPVFSPTTTQNKSSLSFGSNGGISFSPTVIPAYNNCMWADVDTCSPVNVRARERLMVGNAVLLTDNRNGSAVWNQTWVGTLAQTGTNWMARDAQMVSMSDRGSLAVSGMTLSSQGDALGAGLKPAPIGVGGYVVNDTTVANSNAWGGYFEAIHTPNGVSTLTFGVEIDTRNVTASNPTGNPYSIGSGDVGIWLGAGAGAGALNPSNAAIVTTANPTTFNSGIVFKDGSLTKDGNGNSNAITLSHSAQLKWYSSSSVVSAVIDDTKIQLPLTTPASSTAICTVGTMNWDASFIYICTATNTWKRAALSAF